jgi:hypothetical protein
MCYSDLFNNIFSSVRGNKEMANLVGPGRRCLACGAVQAVLAGEPIWPLGWQCSGCGHVVPHAQGVAMFAPELADTAGSTQWPSTRFRCSRLNTSGSLLAIN